MIGQGQVARLPDGDGDGDRLGARRATPSCPGCSPAPSPTAAPQMPLTTGEARRLQQLMRGVVTCGTGIVLGDAARRAGDRQDRHGGVRHHSRRCRRTPG